MKKMMILGGTRYAIPVIEKAHQLGIYTITADYIPNNIAHHYSDEYCNVSIVEQEEVLKKALELKIDGITSFACDPGVVSAAYVAEKMGLPCVGSYESVSVLQNKILFRQFLTDNGFNVPASKGYTEQTKALKDIDMFHWPIMVKPTDSAGSKGVSRVDDPSHLATAIEHALKFSRNGEFILEEYIETQGFSSDTDCFSVDGVFKFMSFNSQRFDPMAENPYTPAAYSWPSSMTDEHQSELATELQRLITLLNLKTSIYNIETREGKNGNAYIMECAPRGGGNRLAECLEYATGVKLVENSVRAAMGMKIIGVEQRPYDGYWAEVILHSERSGVFKSLYVDKSIEGYVYETDLWIEPGTEVKGFRAANEAVGTLVLKFDSEERLQAVMRDPSKYVRIMLQ